MEIMKLITQQPLSSGETPVLWWSLCAQDPPTPFSVVTGGTGMISLESVCTWLLMLDLRARGV